ncbi:hypothetical protein J2Z21_006840 [Streptomyces griseochromogenes]|uniref:Uncharacterized protein n=1 Tax=Streptomyces griseochromogenes TaxID=68214 RepID=A0ABS4M2I2_9ACTN|nr:hypothetical protein [Streptomyces griseochromogenes]
MQQNPIREARPEVIRSPYRAYKGSLLAAVTHRNLGSVAFPFRTRSPGVPAIGKAQQ